MKEFEDRLQQVFLDVDDILSDVTRRVQEASIEVLDYSSHTFLCVPAYTEAKANLKNLERLYLKLKMTKEEYEEYYPQITIETIN